MSSLMTSGGTAIQEKKSIMSVPVSDADKNQPLKDMMLAWVIFKIPLVRVAGME